MAPNFKEYTTVFPLLKHNSTNRTRVEREFHAYLAILLFLDPLRQKIKEISPLRLVYYISTDYIYVKNHVPYLIDVF